MDTMNAEAPVAEAPVAEAPVAEAPVAPKAKKSKVKAKAKLGRGRPPVYTGAVEKAIVKVIRCEGLTGARDFLATTGVQVTPGKAKQKFDISLPTLGKLAKKAKIKLFRGRPKIAA